MSDYQEQAQGEMWDAAAGMNEARDTRRRILVIGQVVQDCNVEVCRIVGTRLFVVSVNGFELPGYHDWTVDALNAGKASATSGSPPRPVDDGSEG